MHLNAYIILQHNQPVKASGLIISELVSNALKHAFPKTWDWPPGFTGEVRVALHSLPDDEYQLLVSDTGIGLPPDFEFPSKDTLGMFLIQSFIEQLRGTVEWSNGKGATCRIVFPA